MRIGILTALLVFFTVPGFTGETDSMYVAFDEIVVTATRTQLPVWRSPVPVTLISEADIDRRGGMTLGDALERSEPLTFRRYGADGALMTMSVRGVAADQSVVLLNGIQINSPQSGLVDLSTIPLSGIERIEIARGGASSLYGNHAMGGVINIITHSTAYDRPAVEVTAGGGSFGLRRINVMSRIHTPAIDLSLGLGRDQADGDFTYTDTFNGNGESVREQADFVQSFATLDGHVRLDRETTLGLFARYSQKDLGTPGSLVFLTPGSRQEDEHLHTALSLSRTIGGDTFATFRPFLIHSDMVFLSGEPESRSRSVIRQLGATFDVNTHLSPGLVMTFGGEISEADVDADNLADGVTRVNTVAYLSGEVNVPETGGIRTALYPSLRYDRFSNNRTEGDRRLYEEITWKLGTTVQPFAYDRFLLRGSVGRNFKAPGLNDMFWTDEWSTGNPDLVPERSTGYDAGVRWEVPFTGGLMVDAGVFFIRARDRIVWVPDTETWIWGPVNLRKVHADGFEFDLRWQPGALPLRLGASYTYQDVRQFITDEETGRETERQLPFVPHHLLSGEAGYDIGGVRFTVYPRYNSKRYTTEANDDRVDGYFLLDIRTDYSLQLGTLYAVVSLDIKNVFDTDYQVIQHYPMPGRNYEVNVRLRY